MKVRTNFVRFKVASSNQDNMPYHGRYGGGPDGAGDASDRNTSGGFYGPDGYYPDDFGGGGNYYEYSGPDGSYSYDPYF